MDISPPRTGLRYRYRWHRLQFLRYCSCRLALRFSKLPRESNDPEVGRLALSVSPPFPVLRRGTHRCGPLATSACSNLGVRRGNSQLVADWQAARAGEYLVTGGRSPTPPAVSA